MPKKKRKSPIPRKKPQSAPNPQPAFPAPDASQRELRLTLMLQTGKALQVIQELDAVPPASLTVTEGLILVAAYTMVSDVEGTLSWMVFNQRSLMILNTVREKAADSPLWHHSMACTLQRMGKDREAEEHFRRYLELEPDDPQVPSMLADSHRRRVKPVFSLPFRKRVEMTWQDFQTSRDALQQLFDPARQEDANPMAVLSSCLFRVVSDFPCNLFEENGAYHFAMGIHNSEEEFLRTRYLLRHAPAALRDRWVFHVGRPQDPFFEADLDGLPLSAQEILLWVEKRPDGGLHLRVYARKLAPMIREAGADSPRVLDICRTMVFRVLGEAAFVCLNCTLEVLPLPVPGEPVQLCRLPFELRDMGYHLSDDPDADLQLPEHPWPLPAPTAEGEPPLRGDILEGSTICPPLVESWQARDTSLVDDWHSFGISPCFLGWPADSMGAEEAASFRERLTDALRTAAGEDAFEVIGWARGSRFYYLDLVAWDFDPVLRRARSFFREAGVPGAFCHSFYPDVSSVSLTGAVSS